eukprot:scaffold253099_cov21-Tisochrysis_lutea.AAC.3
MQGMLRLQGAKCVQGLPGMGRMRGMKGRQGLQRLPRLECMHGLPGMECMQRFARNGTHARTANYGMHAWNTRKGRSARVHSSSRAFHRETYKQACSRLSSCLRCLVGCTAPVKVLDTIVFALVMSPLPSRLWEDGLGCKEIKNYLQGMDRDAGMIDRDAGRCRN